MSPMLKYLLPFLMLAGVAWAAPGEHLKPGQELPPIEGVDQFGKSHKLAELSGPNGLVLVVFRSADW